MNSQSFMNKIKTIIFISALIFSINTNAQWIGSLEIADENIKPWIATSQTEYSGIYHFGESESESELLLSFSEHSIIGKIKSGYWEENPERWKWNYEELKNIRIDKNGNFSSDKYSGKFVIYQDEDGQQSQGLKINNTWTEWIEKGNYEIGTKLQNYTPDDF